MSEYLKLLDEAEEKVEESPSEPKKDTKIPSIPEPIPKLPKKPRKEPEPEESIAAESIYLSSNMIRYFGEQVGVKSKLLRESSVKTRDAIVKILQKARFTK